MARWNDLEWREDVYAAANKWRDECFYNDDSLFSDEKLWTLENIQKLFEYLKILQKQKGKFWNKLAIQMKGATPKVIRLQAEVMWMLRLFPIGKSMESNQHTKVLVSTKLSNIKEIMSQGGMSLPSTPYLSEQVLLGIGKPGTSYLNNLPYMQLFFLNLLCDWKALSDHERDQFKQDDTHTAWQFAEYCDQFLESNLYKPSAALPFRHALLFFLYPDSFERIVSTDHKRTFVQEFNFLLSNKLTSINWSTSPYPHIAKFDEALFEIRQKLQDLYPNDMVDFYNPPIQVNGKSQIDEVYEKYKKTKTQSSISTSSSQSSPQSSPPTSADETPSADDMIDKLIDPDKLKAKEGNKKQVTHYVKERSPSLRKAKIKQFLSKHSTLSCESCGSDASQYPEECRQRVFEVHHKIPLADIDTETEMTVDDLVVLCANCHNAIHATQDLLGVEEFRQSLKSKCAGKT